MQDMKGVGQESSLSYVSTRRRLLTTLWKSLESSSMQDGAHLAVTPDAGWHSRSGHAQRALGMMQQHVARKTFAYQAAALCEHRSTLSLTHTALTTSDRSGVRAPPQYLAQRAQGKVLPAAALGENCRISGPMHTRFGISDHDGVEGSWHCLS